MSNCDRRTILRLEKNRRDIQCCVQRQTQEEQQASCVEEDLSEK